MSKPIDWLESDAVDTYIAGLWSESDRGAIILQAGTLELLLEEALKRQMKHLNSEERTALFGYNGPVGTFSDKIRIANAMGLISRQIMQKIDLFREMRNACAHSREPVSFQSDPIYNAVVCLVSDMRIFIPDKEDHDSIRMAFFLMSLLIISSVISGSVNTGHARLVRYLDAHPALRKTPAT